MARKLKLRTKPYPHQLKAVRRAVKQGSHAFLFEPRLGKTKAALDAIAVQAIRGKVRRVVVIAPMIALDVWVQQIIEHFSLSAAVHVVGESGITASKVRSPTVAFYLVNYDKFSRRGEDEAYRNGYVAEVERWEPDLFVLDESHRVKSAGAVRSQALWRMVRRLRAKRTDGLPYVYLLTGTPNPKGYIDLFAQFRILDESIFGTAKAEFEDEYCVYGRGKRRYTIIRYRRKKQLLRLVRQRATVVTAKQANIGGKQLFNPIRISLPQKVGELYARFAEDLVADVEGEVLDAPNAGVRRLRLLQITGGFTTSGRTIHDAKLRATRDLLEDLFEQRESVVVYARFLAEVAALEQLCRKVGFDTGAITGSVPRKRRTEAIRTFQQDPRQHCLVFQVSAGSLAIELTRAAEVVYYSLPDSWESFYQSLERVRGPKQTRPVRYSFILARGTVDVSVLSALRRKRDMHAEMMRRPRGFLFGL